jgi:16S rRNA (uracil1498-N3)-methyltransferase
VSRRRILLPPARIEAGRGVLDDAARHYLRDVLRLGPGDAVEVFDGRGGRFGGRILPAFDGVALGPREDAPRASAEVTLLFALSKGEKNDLVVQKATELGAACIAPFSAERSVVRLDAAKGEERARRWRRIAAEAARQCRRDDVPAVRAPAPLEEALAALAPGTRTFAFHPGGAPIATLGAGGAAALAAVVGPEGGLGEGELAACERAGALRASLGPRTLRAETAAIVALALLQAHFGDLA